MKNVSIFKKSGSTSWFIQYTDDDGHRKQTSTRTSVKSEALSFLSKLKSEPRKPKEKPKPLTAFTTDFLLYAQSQYRLPTVLIYRMRIENVIKSVKKRVEIFLKLLVGSVIRIRYSVLSIITLPSLEKLSKSTLEGLDTFHI